MTHEERLRLIYAPFPVVHVRPRTKSWAGTLISLSLSQALADQGGRQRRRVLVDGDEFGGDYHYRREGDV